jgi:hypothetical protein
VDEFSAKLDRQPRDIVHGMNPPAEAVACFEQRHADPGAGEIGCCSQARDTSADYQDLGIVVPTIY